jgi:AcrR family transcriptional regulator
MHSHLSTTCRKFPQQKRGEDKVNRLLEAAASVIGEFGYEAATMTLIAERAQTSIGSLYQFFPNKESVAQALRLQYAQLFDQALEAGLASNISDPAELGDLIMSATLDLLERYPAKWQLLDAPSSTKPPAVRKHLVKQMTRLLEKLKPPFDATDLEIKASIILKTLAGMSQLAAKAKPAQRVAISAEYKKLLLGYLRAKG